MGLNFLLATYKQLINVLAQKKEKKKKTKHLFIQQTHTEQSSYYVPTELSRAGRKQRAKGSSSCVPLFSGRIFFLGISLTFLTSLWPELGHMPIPLLVTNKKTGFYD